MTTSKEEKLLSSIDGTLKDILEELKRHGRTENIELKIDGKEIAKAIAPDITRFQEAGKAIRQMGRYRKG